MAHIKNILSLSRRLISFLGVFSSDSEVQINANSINFKILIIFFITFDLLCTLIF